MLFLKTVKDADGNAFLAFIQTFVTLINGKILSNASCASRFKQFILMTPSVNVSTQCKEIIEIYIY